MRLVAPRVSFAAFTKEGGPSQAHHPFFKNHPAQLILGGGNCGRPRRQKILKLRSLSSKKLRFLCKPSHTNLFYFLLRHLETQIRISKNAVEKSHQKTSKWGTHRAKRLPSTYKTTGEPKNCGPILFLPSLRISGIYSFRPP